MGGGPSRLKAQAEKQRLAAAAPPASPAPAAAACDVDTPPNAAPFEVTLNSEDVHDEDDKDFILNSEDEEW